MATKVRTEDEHPLKISDLKLFRRHFKNVRYQGSWLFSLWIFMQFYLIERVNPNDERYWKKVILEADRLKPMYERLAILDNGALRLIPWLTRYCWNISVIAEK
jgi:hypothetical protein